MDQRHYGFEIGRKIHAFSNSLDSSLPGQSTIGFILDNVTGEYKDYANPDEPEEYGYYVKDLKVGDAPQMQGIFGIDVYPVKRWKIQLLAKHYRNHYADWDPLTRTDAN